LVRDLVGAGGGLDVSGVPIFEVAVEQVDIEVVVE
jgi:hypothetical protein